MWRKVLPACSKKIISTALISLSAFLAFQLTAQSLSMPSMPEMPSMPTISTDSSFYTPSFPNTSLSRKVTSNKKESTGDAKEVLLSDAASSEDVVSALLSTETSTLTASDISSLYDSGLFSSISGLNTSSSLSNYTTSTSTNVLLQQVLNSLNDLKEDQKKTSVAEKEALSDVKTDSKTFKQREPAILRFKVNGYNIADSLVEVFFSEPEADGSFLLTGDRKYYLNQKIMTETFYMLFKTVSSTGSSVSYKVQPSIVQSSKNENSFVYKLMSKHDLTAEKTGNLVVMHVNDDNLTADMLLDIDKR